MADFEVDSRIRTDCHCLGTWGDCWVMLHRDASVRWLILVPETAVTEWHELPVSVRELMAGMASVLSAELREGLGCDKVNIAAIGNVVSQFHFHVVGRWRTDPYWPGVVWGRSTGAMEYSDREIDQLRSRCFGALESEKARS
ncbi:MAG: HIT family protein [Syntrophobacteraceae bacterium]